MGAPRFWSGAARATAVLPVLVALSACATSGAARSAIPGAAPEAVSEQGPRVQIWTTNESDAGDRVRTSFRLDDDAYVLVVNVGRDGYANVIFPESAQDDGFMRGGRTYRLPAFFPGFARDFRSEYGRLHNAVSAYDDAYDRYTGYVFVIASRRPMHFQITAAAGLWDDVRLAAQEERLEPYTVMQHFADQLVQGGTRDYTARFARYAAFGRGFGRAASFASCSAYGSLLGDFPQWAVGALSRSWIPIYGLGYYSLGGPQCGVALGITLIGFRPPVGPTVRPPVSPPVRPIPPPSSDDTASKPGHPRPPRRRLVTAAIDDQPIIDVTRETRDLTRRRDRERGVGSGRGYERPERAHVRERVPVDHDRPARREEVRSESRGSESRGSEARREQAPRPEPRSEPRAQPAPRNDPPPRSDPPRSDPPRPEPRSERPVKPVPQ